MNGLEGYLAVLADSDLFGTLATISFLVAVMGFFKKVRVMRAYTALVLICLMFMPALHLIGSYFLSRPPA